MRSSSPEYPPFVPPSTTTTSLTGSENLKPEKIISYELGYQGWYLKHRLRTRASFFLNNLKRLIGQENVGQNLAFANASGEATIQGVEAGAEFLAMPWLTGFGNISYQDIRQSLVGRVRRGGPQWKVNGGLRTEFENGLNGEAVLHFVGSADYPVGPAFTAVSGLLTISAALECMGSRVHGLIAMEARGGWSSALSTRDRSPSCHLAATRHLC